MLLDFYIAEDAERGIRQALRNTGGAHQLEVAAAYAKALLLPLSEIERVDWRSLNEAIRSRWPSKSGLSRVKEMAHREVARLRGEHHRKCRLRERLTTTPYLTNPPPCSCPKEWRRRD